MLSLIIMTFLYTMLYSLKKGSLRGDFAIDKAALDAYDKLEHIDYTYRLLTAIIHIHTLCFLLYLT